MESLLGHICSPLRRESGSPRGSGRGPGQRRGRGGTLPAPPPAPRPRRDGRCWPGRGAQDAVGPHKRFVFTTSFRSLSGLPATIKGQVCSQEKTRVGRGLHMEKCTLQRSYRQRVRLGSVRGDQARHSPPESTSGSAQRGSGRSSCRWLRQGAFCFSPAADAASPRSQPRRSPPGVLGAAKPV